MSAGEGAEAEARGVARAHAGPPPDVTVPPNEGADVTGTPRTAAASRERSGPAAGPAWRAAPGAADTIVAVASAAGRGAVALVRVSGPDAWAVADRVLRPWPPAERVATLCAVREPAGGELVDRALVTAFVGDRSYTGEPLVEVGTHGGLVVPAAVVAAFVAAGAREAEPGEFTRRAVLHGKMDLVQAEAVGDLVDARSAGMRRAALAQLDGGLTRRVAEARERLLHVEALIAYDIDFPEEDDGALAAGRVDRATAGAMASLDALLGDAEVGELVREGAVVVIAGPPNAGKSSLFNALVGRARALVTDVPGTTRDALEAVVDAGPWPLRLVDTAGLRATDDVVERLGIEVSERYLASAHAVLACGATDAEVDAAVARVRAVSTAPVVAVQTKADLASADGDVSARAREGPPPTSNVVPDEGAAVTERTPSGADACALVRVSAERGTGLRELLDAAVRAVAERAGVGAEEVPLVTRARQRRALAEARAELAAFGEAWSSGALPAPVAVVHLRAAVAALETLIGAVGVEDVLDRVFSTFCVGK